MFKSVIDVNDSLFTKVELCRETLEKSRHIAQTYKNVFNINHQSDNFFNRTRTMRSENQDVFGLQETTVFTTLSKYWALRLEVLWRER